MAGQARYKGFFDEVNAAALARYPALLFEWFPAGRLSGNEFECGDIEGNPGKSFKVNPQTGKWADFAGNVRGGDPISLFAAKEGLKQGEAATRLGRLLGIEPPKLRSVGAIGSKDDWTPIVPVPACAPAFKVENVRHQERAPSMYWEYRDAGGALLAYRVRFDGLDGGAKDIIPYTYCENAAGWRGWQPKDLPAPRTLYNVDKLALRPDAPVLVYEGEKKVDAAERLLPEFLNMAWPGGVNRCGTKDTDWGPLLKRKTPIWLWPDNDDKGKRAVRQIAALFPPDAQLKLVVPDPAWPEKWDIADLEEAGWTSNRVREYINAHAVERGSTIKTDPIQIEHNNPRALAEIFIERTGRLTQGPLTIHRWDGRFWRWRDAHYIEVSEDDMRAELGAFTYDNVTLCHADRPAAVVEPKRMHIAEGLAALEILTHLSVVDHRPPCWLDKAPHADSARIIAVKNGLLNLQSGELSPPTPLWFNLSTLQTNYDPNAQCPQWHAFINDVWSDQLSRDVLQEFFGYLITSDMSQQKALAIVGPSRSGKGTIGRVLAGLLGENAVGRPTLADFGYQFGLEGLIGKSLAIISDARLDRDVSEGMLAERLLAITGEDSISVPRKFLASWSGPLALRFVMLMNELPHFRDASGALPGRFIVLKTMKNFRGREDTTLANRLLMELAGILNWAIEGWWRLQERGRFLQPDSELMDEFLHIANPLLDFFEEACEFGEEHHGTISELHRCYTIWNERRGQRFVLPITLFGRNLRAARPDLRFSKPHGQPRQVEGIAPKWSALGLLGDPGPHKVRIENSVNM